MCRPGFQAVRAGRGLTQQELGREVVEAAALRLQRIGQTYSALVRGPMASGPVQAGGA